MSQPIIITGVSGFLGKHLAVSLIKTGYSVYGLSRSNPNIKGLQWYKCDLQNTEQVKTIRTPAPVIIHCASYTRDDRSIVTRNANIHMARNLQLLHPTYIINLSSSSVYDLSHSSVNTQETEATGDYPFLNSYSESKYLIEQLLARNPTPVLNLRPHAIYGEGDTTLYPRLTERIKHNMLILPNKGLVKHDLTWVGNVTHAVTLAIKQQPVGTVNITDGISYPLGGTIKRLTGKELHIIRLPYTLGITIGRIVSNVTSPFNEPKITPYMIAQIGLERTYSLQQAKKLLHYTPLQPPPIEDCYKTCNPIL